MKNRYAYWRNNLHSQSTQPPAHDAESELGVGLDGQILVVPVENSSTSGQSPNSERTRHYLGLLEAISRMALYPEGHAFHVERGAAEKARELVGMLRHNLLIGAPRVFPHEGEAVVLTWREGEVKRLLSIDNEEWSLRDVNLRNSGRCYHNEGAGHDEMPILMKELSLSTISRTSVPAEE